MILVSDDSQVRELLRHRLERDGHHVLNESERPHGADPRHVFCELNTTKEDARKLILELQQDFPNVRAVAIG